MEPPSDSLSLPGVRVCFFNRVKDPAQNYYFAHFANDIRFLRELGCDVRVVTRAVDLRPADVYFIWWWTWAFIPVALAKLLGRPAIVTGSVHAHEYAQRPWWQRRLMAFAFRNATANVFVSESERDTSLAVVDANNPQYVPQVIDTDAYVPGTSTRDPDELFTVVWMTHGNGVRKCVPEMIRAMVHIRAARPGARLVIAGEQADGFPVFSALVRELGLSDCVQFVGVIDEAEKIRRMQTCAVYLQPTHFEGFGTAILEAMSCGAPVVTTAAGAVPQVVGDTAELVRANEPAAIAESALRVLGDQRHAWDLSVRGRARAVREFSLARRRDAIGRIIREAMGGSSLQHTAALL